MSWIFYALAGIVSGVIAGMGMGGGTLLIPILTILLSVEQRVAQGINLIVFVPMSVIALFIHCKNKLVNFKIGVPIICSGVIASICGAFLATKISNHLLQKIFGGFLLLVGLWQIFTIFFPKKNTKTTQVKFISFLKF